MLFIGLFILNVGNVNNSTVPISHAGDNNEVAIIVGASVGGTVVLIGLVIRLLFAIALVSCYIVYASYLPKYNLFCCYVHL